MKIELINHGLKPLNLPRREHPTDVGADVFSPVTKLVEPGTTAKIPLGFGVKVPNGMVGFVYPRSSMSIKGITCELCPIDPSYTGEIHAIVTNNSPEPYLIERDKKVGQLVILPCIIPDFTFGNTETRGDNAFGSTGN